MSGRTMLSTWSVSASTHAHTHARTHATRERSVPRGLRRKPGAAINNSMTHWYNYLIHRNYLINRNFVTNYLVEMLIWLHNYVFIKGQKKTAFPILPLDIHFNCPAAAAAADALAAEVQLRQQRQLQQQKQQQQRQQRQLQQQQQQR